MHGLLDLLLAPARRFELQALAEALDRDPRRDFVQPEQLERWLAPESLDELLAWASTHGLELRDDRRPVRRLRLRGSLSQLQRALGDAPLRALARREPGASAIASRDALPPRLRGLVAHVELLPELDEGQRELELLELHASGDPPPRPELHAVTPASFTRALALPPSTDGRGQRIALMALGGLPRADDLAGFRASFALPPARLRIVQLGPLSPRTRDDPLFRHETTMTCEWITALAPAAELVVYLIDPRYTADPWVCFFEAALADAATVAITAWSSPEQQYYASFGRAVAASLLDQLAVVGCTVIAASGDWGVCAGAPRAPAGDLRACTRPWPGVAFPCCEPRVLAVGGTQGLDRPELLSTALSPDLASRLGLRNIASGGGFSEHVAIPSWQAEALCRNFSRDGAPAIPPSGRGVPDIALPAWGPPAGADRSGRAYWGLIDGRWRDDIGGTSLSAALAAAGIARINQALESHGRRRLGCLGPRLYALARAGGAALRPVTRGTTSVELPCLDDQGKVDWRTIPGFCAVEPWNPGAGLGVLDFGELLERLLAESHDRR